MYTRCLIVFALLLTHISIHANPTIDSLYQIVEAETVDSLKRKAYQSLLQHLNLQHDNQLEEYALEMIAFGEEKQDKAAIAWANLYLGYFYRRESDNEKSLEVLEKSRSLFASLDHPSVMSALAEMAMNYKALGKREQQLATIEEMVETARKLKTYGGLGDAFYSLSIYQNDMGEHTASLESIDSATYYFRLAESFENIAVTKMYKGRLLQQSDPLQAIDLLLESEDICIKHNITRVLPFVYTTMYVAYDVSGKKKEAMEAALKHLAFGEQQNNKQTIVTAQQDLGTLHLRLGNYKEAERYFLESMEIANPLNYLHGRYRGNGSLAMIYEGIHQYEKAVPYYHNSIKMLNDFGYYSELPLIYGSLALCYLEMEEADSAYHYLQKGESHVKEKTPESLTTLNAGFGQYYLHQNQPRKALTYAKEAYEHSSEIDLLQKTANTLYNAYKAIGDYEKALQYHELFKQHQDSVFNQENIQNITRQELTYDFEKEKEVAALQQAQQEALLKAESTQARGIAIGVGILALLASIFLWNTRRQNKIIAQKNGQLEQLNQTKDHIFAVLGHDLRKPALSFRGITEKLHYLIEKQDFKTMNQLGAVLEQNALQLNTLLDNVLNWALTQKSAVTYTPKAIDAHESVAETFQLFKGLASEKNIHLQSSIPKDLKLYVDANSWAVILRNLVDNAIKFTPKGGTVELQAQPSPKGVHISVKDNGIGITPENLKDIFVLKEQKSTRGTKGEKGTGLGLHLVQELVKINQGTIDVQSQIQKGTTFNLLLPSV